jgi:hypothetical protein
MSPTYVLYIKDLLPTNLRFENHTDKILEKELFSLPYGEIIIDFSEVQ